MIAASDRPKKKFIQLAIARAIRPRDRGDYPIGAVITRLTDGQEVVIASDMQILRQLITQTWILRVTRCSGSGLGVTLCSMRTPRFAGPEWLVMIGGSFFIFALTVSAIFVPEIRWLHLVQSSLYVAAIAFSLRRSRWGYFIGASTAGFWDLLVLFASPLCAEILDQPTRPDSFF